VPEYSVFDIGGLSGQKKWALYNRGVVALDDLPPDAPLNARQWQQVQAEREQATYIDRPAIRDFVEGLRYPLYYLDFESYSSPVPSWDHCRPYQQVVFQYSLHIQQSRGGALEHREFLAGTGGDPRIPFIERLIDDLGSSGNVMVYHRAFEVPRLQEIARDFPQYEAPIEKIIARVVDLMVPFRIRQYYSYRQRGSHSIKQVLPSLAPGFSYKGLAIADGGSASHAFRRLYGETDEAVIAATREHLLAYCRMDTLAMVEIVRVLDAVCGTGYEGRGIE
jgi:hypothetical protein